LKKRVDDLSKDCKKINERFSEKGFVDLVNNYEKTRETPRIMYGGNSKDFLLGKVKYKISELKNPDLSNRIVPTKYKVFFEKRWRRVYLAAWPNYPQWFIEVRKDRAYITKEDYIYLTKENLKDFKEEIIDE